MGEFLSNTSEMFFYFRLCITESFKHLLEFIVEKSMIHSLFSKFVGKKGLICGNIRKKENKNYEKRSRQVF